MSERPRRPLEEQILDAFRQAFEARQLTAAEHLLRALEELEGDARPGTALREAYLMLRPDQITN